MDALKAKMIELKNKANNVAQNYTPMEIKVREATDGDEAWGPHGTLMADIAKASFDPVLCQEILRMLWKRILKNSHDGKNWRRIYKGLLVLIHILRNGSVQCVESGRDHMIDLQLLDKFVYVDEKGKDQGINVRTKAKEIATLLPDDERLRDERKKAQQQLRAKAAAAAVPGYTEEDAYQAGDRQDRPAASSSSAPAAVEVDDDDFDPRAGAAAPAAAPAPAPASVKVASLIDFDSPSDSATVVLTPTPASTATPPARPPPPRASLAPEPEE